MFGILAEAAQPVVTGADILEKVSSFFYIAWGMLLAMVVLVAGVVGWLVPWWISRAQKRSFDLKEKDLLDRIDTQREEAERQIEQLEQRLIQKMKEELAAAKGDTYYLQGVVLLAQEGFRAVGVQMALMAAKSYVKATEEQKRKIGISLEAAIDACEGHEEELRSATKTPSKELNELAAEIEDKGLQSRFGDMVERIRKLLEKAEEHTDKASGESGEGPE